jgi:hypothetical protein
VTKRSLPFAVEALEGASNSSGELSSEGLKAYRGSNCATLVDSSIYVARIALKRCSAQHKLAFDCEPHSASLASLAG